MIDRASQWEIGESRIGRETGADGRDAVSSRRKDRVQIIPVHTYSPLHIDLRLESIQSTNKYSPPPFLLDDSIPTPPDAPIRAMKP